MFNWVARLLGAESNEREIKKLSGTVRNVEAWEPEMQSLGSGAFFDKTVELRGRYLAGETLDALLPEAFALAREAARRTTGMRPYPVQIIGGIVLHQGKIAEMKTGEGKTLVATLPLYLNALAGQGAHLVTVNDYLAKRDAQWMGPIYHTLGLTVGIIQHESAFMFDPTYTSPDPRYNHLRPIPRREAYLCDITYGTNNEFGFDYLRDNMVMDLSHCVQRKPHYAIVDEVDNILVDEARTPLIISGQGDPSTDKYYLFARIVPRLTREADYKIEEKTKTVTLTEAGVDNMEKWLGLPNLYDPENYELTHYLEQALKAEFIFKRDRDYVLYKDGQVLNYKDREAEIVIVDEFTGRLMLGRRYSEGLHQAIEAKENVRIRRESQTLATITFQNYFRLYHKLAGMTGTAYTEREEFYKIYNLDVMVIPTHRPMIRNDYPDFVYRSEGAKYDAVVNEVTDLYSQRRPVLVGTVSIERSEHLSEMLKRKGVPHQVLNAKYHEREAGIIAQAGRPGAVTIATNMAGRGVDILLGGNPAGIVDEYLKRDGIDPVEASEEQLAAARQQAEQQCAVDKEKVVALGGLHILGTERHEARRIDNQLRGRAGRQGDPGSSRFYVALDDELMRRFGGSNIANLMERFGVEEDIPIENSLVSKAIENSQTKVEGYNFDIRKHVVEYDDVMNKQREVIYSERLKILSEENLRETLAKMINEELTAIIDAHLPGPNRDDWDFETLVVALQTMLPVAFSQEELESKARQEILDFVLGVASAVYDDREEQVGFEQMRQLERLVMLSIIDRHWVDHLTAIDDLREGIGLRAYGQRDPLVEYKNDAYRMFQELMASIQRDIVHAIYHVTFRQAEEPQKPQQAWTNREEGAPAEPVRATRRTGRNDPCPCGSGKKYKRCCGK